MSTNITKKRNNNNINKNKKTNTTDQSENNNPINLEKDKRYNGSINMNTYMEHKNKRIILTIQSKVTNKRMENHGKRNHISKENRTKNIINKINKKYNHESTREMGICIPKVSKKSLKHNNYNSRRNQDNSTNRNRTQKDKNDKHDRDNGKINLTMEVQD